MAAISSMPTALDRGEVSRRTTEARGVPPRRPRRPADCEARLVFALAGDVADAAFARALPGCDWSRLFSAATQENAVIALRGALRLASRSEVPVVIERQIACVALHAEVRMRRLERRLEEALLALSAAGIQVTVLKGAALASTVYNGFASRPMNDLDLLVDDAQAAAAKEVVRGLGWTRDPTVPADDAYAGHHHLAPLLDASGSGLRLEIHTELLPLENPFAISRADLARATRDVRIGAARAGVLSTVHHAVYATIHFAWSHELHLGAWHTFRDLGTLARRGLLNWDDFVETAQAWRAGTCAYWTLRLGRTLAALPVSDDVLRRLAPRLPDVILDRLERHFIQTALRSGSTCPSVRLNRELWNLAMQPGPSGHGESRPWLASAALMEERRRLEARPPAWRGPLARVGRVFRWSRYLAQMV